MKKFGDAPIGDVPVGPLHYGAAIDATPVRDAITAPPSKDKPGRSAKGKAKMSKATKRSRGRKSFDISSS